MIEHHEHAHLRRCIELAGQALNAGDEPFGSVLVDGNGAVRAEDRNRIAGGDATRHPEFELARWAAAHMTADERAGATTVFTSGDTVRCAPPRTPGSALNGLFMPVPRLSSRPGWTNWM